MKEGFINQIHVAFTRIGLINPSTPKGVYLSNRPGWRRGYLVKTKTFVFGRIAEISARYRRQNDRTDAARLFCRHISLAKKNPKCGWRSLRSILEIDP